MRSFSDMERILIIEDDEDIAEIEKDYLALSGYSVVIEKDGNKGLHAALNGKYDLILLDLMLPGIDGLEICRRIRDKTKAPILMVTAKISDSEKIRGLGLGADDYIEKPFSPSVLVARVKAHIAQCKRLSENDKKAHSPVLEAEEITINTATHRVFKNGNEIELKNKEYELLLFFVLNKGILFSREELYEKIWGVDALGDSSTVAVHINRLREKLEDDPSAPKHITTVRGAGYRFV